MSKMHQPSVENNEVLRRVTLRLIGKHATTESYETLHQLDQGFVSVRDTRLVGEMAASDETASKIPEKEQSQWIH